LERKQEEQIMARMYYFTPGTVDEKGTQLPGVTWTHVNDKELTAKDDLDAIDQIKAIENIKRVPPTWKIFLEKNGEFLEVNRRSISRKRMEAKRLG